METICLDPRLLNRFTGLADAFTDPRLTSAAGSGPHLITCRLTGGPSAAERATRAARSEAEAARELALSEVEGLHAHVRPRLHDQNLRSPCHGSSRNLRIRELSILPFEV